MSLSLSENMPPKSSTDDLYESRFYEEDKPDYLNKMTREWEYWRNCVYIPRLETLASLTEGRTLCDVGCGGGFFLQAAKDTGWAITGIEPSRMACDYAGGITPNIHCGRFEDFDFQQQRFDAIHLSFVLEHVPDPVEMLAKAYDLLVPGGILCVEVPNDFSPLQKHLRDAMGYPEYWVQPEHHINYFILQTLCWVLVNRGFKIEATETTFPMEFFLLMGDNYVGNDALGEACHKDRMTFETNLMLTDEGKELKRQLYDGFKQLGIGRSIVVYAQK